jgi:hypothetical protein
VADVPWWMWAWVTVSSALMFAPCVFLAGRRPATPDSSGPAGAPGHPTPPSAPACGDTSGPEDTLTVAERRLLDLVRGIVTTHHLNAVITENGQQLADVYRQAMPAASDRGLAKVMLAHIAITHTTVRQAVTPVDGLIVCSDAMLGAVVDLARLDEEVTTR